MPVRGVSLNYDTFWERAMKSPNKGLLKSQGYPEDVKL